MDDLPRVLELAHAFHAASTWAKIPFDDAAFLATAAAMVEADEAAIFLGEDGMCGGLINGLYFSPQTRVAIELFWWAPREGTALRQAFEAWATAHDVAAIQFSAMANERRTAVERLYRAAGYAPAETAFVKESA
jgi:hypothetical protein